ncbi:hypothetical protein [Chryseobacterium sp.]|uniref:hypothetical protein n=1 Tax=Chryseobacterium sp. TaxID=1871047 RepID=UPI0025BCC129|nr:hypothetical protein [Chryseobacterium sp.]
MKRKNLYVCALTVFLIGCEDFKKSIDDTLSDPESISEIPVSNEGNIKTQLPERNIPVKRNNTKKEKGILTADIVQLEDAENALRSLPQFTGKSIFVYKSVHFYDDGRISIQIQNPENSEYVDEYWYQNGHWKRPEPLRLSKNEDIKADLINLNKIPFKNANNVYNVITEKKKEIKNLDQNYTLYAIVRKGKILWYPTSIKNERSTYSITYKENGTLESFRQK